MSKKLKIFGILAIAALLILPGTAFADKFFCKGATGATTAGFEVSGAGGYARLCRAFVAIPGERNGQVIVGSFSATGDDINATGNAYIYDKEDFTAVSAATPANSMIIPTVDTGTMFDAGDLVCLQSPSGDVIEVFSVSHVGGGSVALNGSFTTYAIGPGWFLYEMEQIATIPIGFATISYQSNVAVVAGERNSPVLVLLGGITGCVINFCSGNYQ